MKIFVGNLSGETTEDDLRQAFETFGEVKYVNRRQAPLHQLPHPDLRLPEGSLVERPGVTVLDVLRDVPSRNGKHRR